MKPTLFLLAAGMGSRYGGLKQLDGLGPNGETIMDYSIYDAVRAGFGKIVWVIRKDFEEQFRTQILAKYEGVREVLHGERRVEPHVDRGAKFDLGEMLFDHVRRERRSRGHDLGQ